MNDETVTPSVAVSHPVEGDNVTTTPTNPEPTSKEVAGVRALLLARHAEDLPTRETFDKHPHAEKALHSVALNDEKLVVRARALQLLGLYPTADSEKLLLAVVADTSHHAKLRAAALHGLGAYDLESREDLRAVVVDQLQSSDVMVGIAAVIALRDVASAVADLRGIAEQEGILKQVKDAARKALHR